MHIRMCTTHMCVWYLQKADEASDPLELTLHIDSWGCYVQTDLLQKQFSSEASTILQFILTEKRFTDKFIGSQSI